MKKKKKSIHELAKEYPDKTYRDLEKYRDADRWEEAIGIGHNHPPSPIEEDKDKWQNLETGSAQFKGLMESSS